MQDRYLKCDTVEGCWLDLSEAGLAEQDDEGNWHPAEGVSVDVIENKPYPNAPPGLIDLNEKAPELTQEKIADHYSKSKAWKGPHMNVRMRSQEDADALDSAPLSNGSQLLAAPAMPYRVWA